LNFDAILYAKTHFFSRFIAKFGFENDLEYIYGRSWIYRIIIRSSWRYIKTYYRYAKLIIKCRNNSLWIKGSSRKAVINGSGRAKLILTP